MTTLAEQVEEEQAGFEAEEEDAEAEAEEPDTESEEPESEEPEALVQIGPEEIRKAERAIAAQQKRLAGILGEEAVAHECVMCSGIGYLAGLPPLGTEFTFVAGESGPELAFREAQAAPEYKPASDKDTCSECDGYGQTLTGAKPPAQVLWQCAVCDGKGYLVTGAIVVTSAAPVPAQGAPVLYAPPPQEGIGLDAWGREPGHRHWGVAPNLIPG